MGQRLPGTTHRNLDAFALSTAALCGQSCASV
jgi:hypothetical protein